MASTTSEQANLSRRSVMRGASAAGVGVMAAVVTGRRFAPAQDATPDVDRSITRATRLDPVVGEMVVLIGTDGQPLVEYTTDDYLDGWQDYAPNQAPARGTRYIAVTMTATVRDRAVFYVRARELAIQDADGFLSWPISIRNEDGSVDGFLQDQNVEPGNTISGRVVYALPQGIEPARLYYTSYLDRLLTLAELRRS